MSIQVSAGAQAGDHMAINKLRLTGRYLYHPRPHHYLHIILLILIPSLLILSLIIPTLYGHQQSTTYRYLCHFYTRSTIPTLITLSSLSLYTHPTHPSPYLPNPPTTLLTPITHVSQQRAIPTRIHFTNAPTNPKTNIPL